MASARLLNLTAGKSSGFTNLLRRKTHFDGNLLIPCPALRRFSTSNYLFLRHNLKPNHRLPWSTSGLVQYVPSAISNNEQRRGFRKEYPLADEREPPKDPDRRAMDIAFYGALFIAIFFGTFDVKSIWKERIKPGWKRIEKFFTTKAASPKEVEDERRPVESESQGGQNGGEKESKKGGSFRDRKIVEYENRIRHFSTPDKIFRYFATIKVVYDDHESEIFMTPDDFLRAVTPGLKQPDGYGLDQFKKVDLSKGKQLNEVLDLKSEAKLNSGLKKESIFYKLSNYGLINFSDFLFLLTVISVSNRHFKIAFRMFDLNGDGNVDYEEFEKVQNAILHQTSVGQKLGSATKSTYRGVSSALAKYFFGSDLKKKLTIDKFLDFQEEIQKEMLTLEFNRKKPVNGKIKETDFSELLIAYAGFPEKKRIRMVNRVRKLFPDKTVDESSDRGISLSDYLLFHRFLQNINDVDIALTFFNIAGASIDEGTLKHAAKTVANVDLADHLIKVVFILFDENLDGQLSNKEFISVMKERLRRGLNRPKDTGFIKFASAVWNSFKMDLF